MTRCWCGKTHLATHHSEGSRRSPATSPKHFGWLRCLLDNLYDIRNGGF